LVPELELNRRGCGWWFLLVNVISKITKLILNIPEVIMNALIIALSVVL
jgi:hypothetical protein